MRNRAVFIGVFFLFTMLTLSAGISRASESSQEVIVSAAASLTNAFSEIGRAYEQQKRGVKMHFNFLGTGDLKRQIEAGAPVDVFASASTKDMDDLAAKGLLTTGPRKDFAVNRIVLVRRTQDSTAVTSFEDLTKSTVRRIGIGNPATVPAGRYARQVLSHLGLLEGLGPKLIYGESVRQVLDYAVRGEVDAAIVYSTDAALRSKEVRLVATAPAKTHDPAVYTIAVVKGTKAGRSAEDFVRFVLSPAAQAVLARHGFLPVKAQ